MGSRAKKTKQSNSFRLVIDAYRGLSIHEKINYKWLEWSFGRQRLRIKDSLMWLANHKDKYPAMPLDERLKNAAHSGATWLSVNDFYPRIKVAA